MSLLFLLPIPFPSFLDFLKSESELTISEALYDEQKRMFGNSDGTFRDVEYEEVKNMPVMDSCIREALRLVSCSPFSRQPLASIKSLSPAYPILLHSTIPVLNCSLRSGPRLFQSSIVGSSHYVLGTSLTSSTPPSTLSTEK